MSITECVSTEIVPHKENHGKTFNRAPCVWNPHESRCRKITHTGKDESTAGEWGFALKVAFMPFESIRYLAEDSYMSNMCESQFHSTLQEDTDMHECEATFHRWGCMQRECTPLYASCEREEVHCVGAPIEPTEQRVGGYIVTDGKTHCCGSSDRKETTEWCTVISDHTNDFEVIDKQQESEVTVTLRDVVTSPVEWYVESVERTVSEEIDLW